jgi:pyruvate,orthophosphate dikinase
MESLEDLKNIFVSDAEGVGLCRTEFMFFQRDRINLFRRIIISNTVEQRRSFLEEMSPLHQEDFRFIFRSLPVKIINIRLMDPPLHEILSRSVDDFFMTSSYEEELADVADALGMSINQCLGRINGILESFPTLGFRGFRTALLFPEIIEMQTKTIIGIFIILF